MARLRHPSFGRLVSDPPLVATTDSNPSVLVASYHAHEQKPSQNTCRAAIAVAYNGSREVTSTITRSAVAGVRTDLLGCAT